MLIINQNIYWAYLNEYTRVSTVHGLSFSLSVAIVVIITERQIIGNLSMHSTA